LVIKPLYKNTGIPGSGFSNAATGYRTLFSNAIGSSNTANGEWALHNNTTGGDNVAKGFGALCSNTNGYGNIALGRDAGSNLTTGNVNIDIGNAGVACCWRLGRSASAAKEFTRPLTLPALAE
jgi:hypothetical protein